MNYKQRFNKIVEEIGKRREMEGQGDIERMEGIDRIYDGGGGYITITAKRLEITRACDGSLYNINFTNEADWNILNNLTEKIEGWFSYVESKVNAQVPDRVVVDGRVYKLVE